MSSLVDDATLRERGRAWAARLVEQARELDESQLLRLPALSQRIEELIVNTFAVAWRACEEASESAEARRAVKTLLPPVPQVRVDQLGSMTLEGTGGWAEEYARRRVEEVRVALQVDVQHALVMSQGVLRLGLCEAFADGFGAGAAAEFERAGRDDGASLRLDETSEELRDEEPAQLLGHQAAVHARGYAQDGLARWNARRGPASVVFAPGAFWEALRVAYGRGFERGHENGHENGYREGYNECAELGLRVEVH